MLATLALYEMPTIFCKAWLLSRGVGSCLYKSAFS